MPPSRRDGLGLPAEGLRSRNHRCRARESPEVVLYLVGVSYAEPAMRAMAPCGRVRLGRFSGGVSAIPMHVIFNKNGTLLGIEAASGEIRWLPCLCPGMTRQLFEWYGQEKLSPVATDILPVDHAAAALRAMTVRVAARSSAIALPYPEQEN